MERLNKEERQQKLKEKLDEDPFLVDRELAELFGVSIQTIRLDRKELGIPEVRERIKSVARSAYSKVKSVQRQEIIGELITIELNKSGLSILETSSELALADSNIVRGHHIFAQANSLAVAIIDTDRALTGSADIRYQRSVKVDERLVAKAEVSSNYDNKFKVSVNSKVGEDIVFSGQFTVFAFSEDI